jgi:thymidylate synthase ThyX
MTPEFTAEEQKRLAAFFTNLERPIFGLKLPQEVAGALFSRYSRSSKSLRRTFLDEFLGDPELGLKDLLGGQPVDDDSAALKKARAFYDRVLVGYGDDSVAQLGGAHVACENISNVAAKLLEDARIGIAPLEKSTRYVRFDHKDAGGELSILQRTEDHGVAPPWRLSRNHEPAIRYLLAADGADAGVHCQSAAHRASGSARSEHGQDSAICRCQQ